MVALFMTFMHRRIDDCDCSCIEYFLICVWWKNMERLKELFTIESLVRYCDFYCYCYCTCLTIQLVIEILLMSLKKLLNVLVAVPRT